MPARCGRALHLRQLAQHKEDIRSHEHVYLSIENIAWCTGITLSATGAMSQLELGIGISVSTGVKTQPVAKCKRTAATHHSDAPQEFSTMCLSFY